VIIVTGAVLIARHEQQFAAEAERALPGPLPQLHVRQ
jgi:hypothetical protein